MEAKKLAKPVRTETTVTEMTSLDVKNENLKMLSLMNVVISDHELKFTKKRDNKFRSKHD